MKQRFFIGSSIGAMFTLLPALLCAAILFSCSKGEEPEWEIMDNNAVEFMVLADNINSTKVTDSEFEDDDIINVFGVPVHDNGNISYSSPYLGTYTSGPLSFPYSSVNKTGDVVEKVYISDYYWPVFDQCDYQSLRFYAYYAYNTGTGSNTTGPAIITSETGAPSFKYLTDIIGCASKEDFLIAQQEATQNDVVLNFKRPLSKVTFKVSYEDFIGTTGLDLNMPVISSGTFNYHSVAANENGSGWTLGTEMQDFKLKYSDFISGSGATELIATCYLIPQEIKTFSVVWNYHKEARVEGFLDLMAGKAYTVTINVSRDHVIRVESEFQTSSGTIKNSWKTVTNTNNI